MPDSAYVLVTPAKNEAATVGSTIASVVKQRVLPAEWIIASDGSTDETDAIVDKASRAHPWIRLVQLPPREKRSFAAVVKATETAVKCLSIRDYAFIGLLDADVTFEPGYFASLLARFHDNPRLGLAGGMVVDIGTNRRTIPRNRSDIPGAVQFFRRECFESLGGLIAIPEGGWDALTCAKARMNGFETALFVDLVVDHLKPRNVAEGGLLRRKWQLGIRDYALGYHPLFELAKCASRFAEAPWIIGATAWWIGYCTALIRRAPRTAPGDLLAFIRAEQLQRLRISLIPRTSSQACNP